MPFMWLDYASKDADPASGQAFYLFSAPNGMPLRVEDASGRVTWQSEGFDAYGNQAAGAAPPPVRLRFAGHFYDEDLRLFYNRFRDYDPALARYLQPDPLGHEGGVNLYACPANPEVEVDLRGLSALGHKKPNTGGKRGKGNGKKKPKKGAKPKPLKGVSAAERKLAASPGNSLAQRQARRKVVTAFLDGHAKEWDKKTKSFRKPNKTEIRKHMRGHDVTKPVVVGPPPPINPNQSQWQRKNGNQGQYYGDKSSTPSELGISPYARGKDGRYESKEQKDYKVDRDTPYLESTSKPINDDWSVSGQKVPAKGGAQQRVIGDRSKAKPKP